MEVILNQDVEKIGKSGAVVKVKDGFARNFLIPNGLAVPLTPANLKKLEEANRSKSLKIEKEKKDSVDLKARLENFSLTIAGLVKEGELLYAGIDSQAIAAALTEEGFPIDKHNVLLDEPIKALGIYEVAVKLHPEVIAKIKMWVVKK